MTSDQYMHLTDCSHSNKCCMSQTSIHVLQARWMFGMVCYDDKDKKEKENRVKVDLEEVD